jgi:formate hydrogenlyase transcriptional activator
VPPGPPLGKAVAPSAGLTIGQGWWLLRFSGQVQTEPVCSVLMSRFEKAGPSIESLARSLEFETLLADLSARFVSLPAGEVDREIEDALRRVCEPLGIDLAVLWQWSSAAPAIMTPTHAYDTQGVLPPAAPLRQELFPWVIQHQLAGRKVVIPSVEEMPAEAAVDQENARLLGIKSNLTLPLSVGGEPPVGALALSALSAERDWPEGLVTRLQLIAQVFTNALARRRHELSLQKGEARLEAAAELAGLGFYEVDFGDRVAFFDDRLCNLCGVPPERLEGLGSLEFWIEHLHPDDRQRVFTQRQELHDGRLERLSIEYRYQHPAHGERWFHHVACVARRDANGHAVRTFGVLRDITERRQKEEALLQSYREIERLKDRLQAESDYLKAEIQVVQAHGEFTGQSSAIKRVLHLVEQVAATDSSVLIHGETGTGKELVAQAIHRLSPRGSHVMVKVNCAALPSGLVESELFGREKGAYTGALTRQIGRFEVADGSTLFLDEIGELSPEVQVKLLRVLEAGEFERLGSPRTIKVDVRVIAATNRDLAEAVRTGCFREDLYYRLSVFPIRVPALRERAEDIPLLVWTFVKEFSSRMGKKITQVPRQTMETLQCHPWPGNVRQLRNTIEHGVIITAGETLMLPTLDEAMAAPPQTAADAEREHILRELERAGWHIKGPNGAAAVLGLNPATLYSRMKKLGIRPLR